MNVADLPASDGAHNQEGVCSGAHRAGEQRIQRFVRKVASTRKETDERASLVRSVVANRAPQHRVARLQGVQHRGDSRGVCDVELYLAIDSRQRPQRRRERDPDRSHGSVWTSTEDTLGKYCAINSQVSPASADEYTCPPVVPK